MKEDREGRVSLHSGIETIYIDWRNLEFLIDIFNIFSYGFFILYEIAILFKLLSSKII